MLDERDGDFHQLIDDFADQTLYATRLVGQTHYLVASASEETAASSVELARLVTRFRTGAETARPAPEAAREGRHQPARNPVRRAQAQIAAAAQQWEEF